MIGYNCKYTPVEIFSGFGEKCRLMNMEADNFNYSSNILHPNMCSHAKAMLEEIHSGVYDKFVFMNCCDSSRRAAEAVMNDKSKFTYCFDLPTCSSACGVEKLKNDLIDFIYFYENQTGKKFDFRLFLSSFKNENRVPTGKYIAVLGARSSKTLLNAAEKCFGSMEIYDLTCAQNRSVKPIDAKADEPLEEIMLKYAKALFSQTPCMRMQDIRSREMLVENENCAGIIYSTIKFCDYYDFEYSRLKNLKTPIIRIETDFTNQSYGQLLTRLEGFAETVCKTNIRKAKGNMSGKYFAGIDSGSTSTELVVIDENKNVVKNVMVRTGANAAQGAKKRTRKIGYSF